MHIVVNVYQITNFQEKNPFLLKWKFFKLFKNPFCNISSTATVWVWLYNKNSAVFGFTTKKLQIASYR